MSRGRVLSIALASAALLGGVGASSAAAVSSTSNPPAGANDFSCKPSAAHPNPVVLLHGLGAAARENWGYFSPVLKARGYCVFAVTYGMDPRFPNRGGTISVKQSAPEIGAFVDRVLAATGAAKVDFVGHSEGTFTPEYWLKVLGGGPKVDKYVAWTPVYDGSKLLALDAVRDLGGALGKPVVDLVAAFCGFCPEVLAGSDVVKALNAGGSGTPGVKYTTVMTKYDELVVPYTSGINDRPDATNIVLQDVCPTDLAEHVAVAVDPTVAQITLNALDPANAKPVRCEGQFGAAPPAAQAKSKAKTSKARKRRR